jgi:RNA polymerase sigma-70 factor (ECF subfamily)
VTVTDNELVELARQGDSSAFGELVDRHHRAALRAAMAALRSPEEAADAAQEAWMAARERLADFRGDASFRTWLLTIVWNKALDRRRSVIRWMSRMVSIDRHDDGTASPWNEATGPRAFGAALQASPADAALGNELRRAVRTLVAALPARLRDPLLLVGSGDYTYDEVAEMLGQPVGTVKWRVSDARRQLRTRLAHLGFGEPAGRVAARRGRQS